MRNICLPLAAAIALALGASACADAPPTAPAAPAPSAAADIVLDGVKLGKLASLVLTPNKATLNVGDSLQIVPTFVDIYGNILTRDPDWSTSDSSVATVDDEGLVEAIRPGTAMIIARNDRVDTAFITVAAPPPQNPPPAGGGGGGGGVPMNQRFPLPFTPAPQISLVQPPGQYLLADRGFNSTAVSTYDVSGAEDWDPVEARYPRFTIEQDQSAPFSPNSVAQILYPQGFVGGSAPALAQKWFTTPTRELYLSLWIQLSPNFQGNRSSTNKMFFLWINNGQRFFLSAEGAGSNVLQPQVRLQGVPDKRARLKPNVDPTATVDRGVWQHWELVVRASSPGRADGVVQWWIDGRKITDYRDLAIVYPWQQPVWDQLQWSPTWGGGGDMVKQDMWVRWDHVFISGK